jgi:hypothetical protein
MSLPRRNFSKPRGSASAGSAPAYVGTAIDGLYEVSLPPSSNVAGAVYEPETATLSIKFNNGAVYNYLHVPDTVVRQLSASSSAGRFVHQVLSGYINRRSDA